MLRSRKMKIPKPIATFIEATNRHNSDELIAVIAETAIVNDEGHDYRGIAEIKKWSDEKVFGARVTLEPIKVIERNTNTTVAMKIDGNFDKTGLPDPFVMDFHFTIDSDKITKLHSIPGPQNKLLEGARILDDLADFIGLYQAKSFLLLLVHINVQEENAASG